MEVNLDLMSFVETSILPRYTAFGRSHGLSHVQRVIANSLELARRTGADINMVYAIAAYHDLGMSGACHPSYHRRQDPCGRCPSEEVVLARANHHHEGSSGGSSCLCLARASEHLRKDCRRGRP